MSKFNYSNEFCDQVEQLDDKLAEIITLVKNVEKRVSILEKIAQSKGLMTKNKTNIIFSNKDDTCIIM